MADGASNAELTRRQLLRNAAAGMVVAGSNARLLGAEAGADNAVANSVIVENQDSNRSRHAISVAGD